MKSRVNYEIELKSVITIQEHDKLLNLLQEKYKEINSETVHTRKYTPGDIRLRNSKKRIEIISKTGDPTSIVRKEITVPLQNMKQLQLIGEMLSETGHEMLPPWTKTKNEFITQRAGYEYVICLQDIKKFAYILEVEHNSETNDSEKHKKNIIKIMQELGCKPVEPEEFKKQIAEYIRNNQKKSEEG